MIRAILLGLLLAWVVPAQAQPASSVADDLSTLKSGTDTGARMAAAKRLAAARDGRVTDALLAALGDENRDVRWAVIEALGERGDRRAVTPLVEALKRPEAYRWSRRLIADALGVIADPAAIPALTELLGDEDRFARRLAALALVRIGTPAALAPVEALLGQGSDETLATVRREHARAAARARGAVTRAPAVAAAPAPATVRPREWAGLRVGATRLADVRQTAGAPLQQAADFVLYRGDRFASPLRTDSVVLNADARGVIESIFVFPQWGTVDRDVRALLGQGKVTSYAEYLKASGRADIYGAGTRAGGKLHYLPPDAVTEAYAEMGMVVVYDTAEPGQDRLVKLIIVH